MITGKQKTVEEIWQLVEPYQKVLILGCGTCVTICFAGGENEVSVLASTLRLKGKISGTEKEFLELTIKRQCEWEFLDEIAEEINQVEAVLSLACGVGVQAIAEHFPSTIVLPGLNTMFMGLPQEPGFWSERCLGCGDCILGLTGGICPITRCSKSLFNGPCGGSVDGKCEISPDIPCAWQLIYDRLARLGLLSRMEEIAPPRDWGTSHSGGPRSILREDVKLPKAEEAKPSVL